uniref:Peptidase S1 domain-containing protein n=1 Tax=Anopheles culicifacies TaxID=139723 RepID=A0A182ML04_9DIPT
MTHVGAGTLIHPKFVLTTAHTCKDFNQYVARFGEWNMDSTAEIYPVQEIEIMETIKHPQYRPGNLPGNDIGLAVLRENVIYSEHIRPICLPNADDNFEDQKCISSGWGLDVRTGKPPALMKRMELEIISHARCQMLYWLVDSNIKLDFTTMCVKGTKGQYTAKKDGGSPLACERDDGSYVLAGIASWGVITYSQQSEFPTGQMDVTKFVGWINDTINSYDGLQAKTDNRIQFLGRIERMPVLYANPHQESKGR